jgi:hypothetical protein
VRGRERVLGLENHHHDAIAPHLKQWRGRVGPHALAQRVEAPEDGEVVIECAYTGTGLGCDVCLKTDMRQ